MSRPRSPRERLVHRVQELERLEEAKQAAADALRAGFASARQDGFDPSTLKVVLRLRKMTPEQRKERRALEAIYMAALGMLEGDALPEEARRRLDGREAAPPPAAAAAPQTPKGGPEKTPAPTSTATPESPPRPQRPLPLKDPEDARKEGAAAAREGKRIYDNPYPAGDPCRAAWDEGWCAQRKSHGMEAPAAYQRRDAKPPDNDAKGAGAGDGEEKGAA
jgi:uncharacterized protein (UPF0335 family)